MVKIINSNQQNMLRVAIFLTCGLATISLAMWALPVLADWLVTLTVFGDIAAGLWRCLRLTLAFLAWLFASLNLIGIMVATLLPQKALLKFREHLQWRHSVYYPLKWAVARLSSQQ